MSNHMYCRLHNRCFTFVAKTNQVLLFYGSTTTIEVLQGAHLSLNGSHITDFLSLFCHFEGQRYWTFYVKNHRH